MLLLIIIISYKCIIVGNTTRFFTIFLNKRIIIRNNVLVDFNILKSCDHFILTNSSFAWWGAYLSNKNHNKKVIHPNSIFINKEDPRNNIQNYIPNNWIVI